MGGIAGGVSNNQLFETFHICSTDNGTPLIGDVELLSLISPPGCQLPCQSQIVRRGDVQIINGVALSNEPFSMMNNLERGLLFPGVFLLIAAGGSDKPIERFECEMNALARHRYPHLPRNFLARRRLEKAERAAAKRLVCAIFLIPAVVVCLFAQIVFGEITFNSSAIPKDEGNEQVGQWGGWFLAVLVILAAFIVQGVTRPQEQR